MLNKDEVLVVIPTLNEEETIAKLVRDIRRLGYEVLVIDDGTDATRELAYEAGAILQAGRGSLGGSIRDGIRDAYNGGYKYVVTIDAGNSHNPSDIPLLHQTCDKTAADLCIGSRCHIWATWYGWRAVLSRLATWLFRPIAITTDATSGYRCYRTKSVHRILHRSTARGHSIQMELLGLISKRGGLVLDIPIVYWPSNSNFRLRDIFEAMWVWVNLILERRQRAF